MHFNDRDAIIALTPQWKGERLPDGRPKVEDKYLDALRGMTLEEVWKPIFVLGYENQFVGGGENPLYPLHDDGRKLIGRAVTCSFCPTRPDLHEVMFARGAEMAAAATIPSGSSTPLLSVTLLFAICTIKFTRAGSSAEI